MAITSSSIVATPSENAWSQAVSFLPFFVVISLKKIDEPEEIKEEETESGKEETLEEVIKKEGEEEETEEEKEHKPQENELAKTGKSILQKLQEELLNLETLNHSHLKDVVEKIRVDPLPGMEVSLVVAALDGESLYVFCEGEARVLLKRGEKFGTLAETHGQEKTSISGFLENDDVVVVETTAFSDVVSDSEFSEIIKDSSPAEISEVLSPKVHEKKDGLTSSLFFSFEKDETPEIAIEPGTIEESAPKNSKRPSFSVFNLPVNSEHINSLKEKVGGRRILLLGAGLILLVLVGGVFFSLRERSDASKRALFERVYAQAQTDFEEGQSLISLNETLAREDLLSAKNSLEEIRGEFPEDSEERKKIDELLSKIEQVLAGTSSQVSVEPTVVSENESDLLKAAIEGPGDFFVQNEESVFSLDENAIYSTPLGEDELSEALSNDNLWQSPGGLGVYNTNLYVLDKSSGEIYKFIGTDGDTRSEYLNDGSYNFKDAKSITIDGAIYVLLKSGKVFKFLRGVEESFEITNLEIPISNATRIFTNEETENLYILDNGNARIVVVDKNGAFQQEYRSPAFSKALEIDVKEGDGKLYFLLDNKVFEINLR